MSSRSTVVRSNHEISSDLDGEIVILDFQSGVYYGLDAVGARIWELLDQPRTFESIRDTLLAEYDIDPDRCDREVQALLARLAAEGLIEFSHEGDLSFP